MVSIIIAANKVNTAEIGFENKFWMHQYGGVIHEKRRMGTANV